MHEYTFVTVWKLKHTSLAEAWNTIKAVEEWPQWWKGVISVTTIKEGDADCIGKVSRFIFKSVLPYRLVFQLELIRLQHHHFMIGQASGELEGTGTWTFDMDQDVVRIQYNWNVKTTRAWMNVLAPILKPAFKWNHDVVMRRGWKGLAKKLHATMVNDDAH
ncbi:MAG: SRPBCC family protein [Chitinophagales bacterium]|nr:SRPBCC family protein [Chitinophagales bacterium]